MLASVESVSDAVDGWGVASACGVTVTATAGVHDVIMLESIKTIKQKIRADLIADPLFALLRIA
jgi:hypothetical protein